MDVAATTSTSRYQSLVLFKGFFDWTRQDPTGSGQDGAVQHRTGQDKDRIRTDRHTHTHWHTHTHMNVLYVMLSSSSIFFDFSGHSPALEGIAGVVQVRKNTLPNSATWTTNCASKLRIANDYTRLAPNEKKSVLPAQRVYISVCSRRASVVMRASLVFGSFRLHCIVKLK